MKRRIALMVLGWCCAASPCAAEVLRAESRIAAVTVFPDRAAITRQAVLVLPAGAHTVEIGPLPSQVEPSSVTAQGTGKAQVVLYEVRLITKQLEAAQDPRVKTLEETVRETVRHQQALRDTKRVLEQERVYLNSIQAASSEQLSKDLVTTSPSAADAASILAFLHDSLLKNFQQDQDADAQLEESSRALDKLRRELAELTQASHKQEASILVDLEARQGGAFTLEVSYRVAGATWQPSYEARAATSSDQVELVSFGVVRQQTGEEWTDVPLTLSTAKPAMAGSMPELQPWFLRPWEPAREYGGRYRGNLDASQVPLKQVSVNETDDKDGKSESLGEGRYKEESKKVAELASAAVETQGPSVTFQLPKPVSLPGDWQPHKVPIGSAMLKAELAYETTPRLLTYAFLRAKVANATELFYLPGPVSVFLDGAFVATAALKQVAPGETFTLFLGVDERVKIERKPLKERVEVSLLPGLRGKTKSTEYEFLTTVENFTGRRVTVTVFDQVPVSEREAIVVESIKQTPPEVEQDKEKPGVFHWTLDLGPNQKQELKLAYRVRHPVEMVVQ
ncbi:MAG: mucoidy inhibitor MuiA family protein [Candidatus Omnitrophica bacterium]|nr:mucoidy inhibitor MuiA family protein [Candidatus Omnitrophota bacterium]